MITSILEKKDVVFYGRLLGDGTVKQRRSGKPDRHFCCSLVRRLMLFVLDHLKNEEEEITS